MILSCLLSVVQSKLLVAPPRLNEKGESFHIINSIFIFSQVFSHIYSRSLVKPPMPRSSGSESYAPGDCHTAVRTTDTMSATWLRTQASVSEAVSQVTVTPQWGQLIQCPPHGYEHRLACHDQMQNKNQFFSEAWLICESFHINSSLVNLQCNIDSIDNCHNRYPYNTMENFFQYRLNFEKKNFGASNLIQLNSCLFKPG